MITEDLADLALPPAKDVVILIADALALGPAYSGNQLNSDNFPAFYDLAVNYPIIALKSSKLSPVENYRALSTGLWPESFKKNEAETYLKSKAWTEFWRHYKKQEVPLKLLAIWDGDDGENTKLLTEFLDTAKRKKITSVSLVLSVAGDGLVDSKWLKKYLQNEWPVTITILAGTNWLNNNNHDWVKTNLSYQAVILGLGTTTQSFNNYWVIAKEDLAPVVLVDSYGQPLSLIDNNDVAVCLGFSNYDWRQLLFSIIKEDWSRFTRLKTVKAVWFSNRLEVNDLPIEVLTANKEVVNKLLITAEETAVVTDAYKLGVMNHGWFNNMKPASLVLINNVVDDEEKISEAKKRTQELLDSSAKVKIINLSWLEQAGRSGSLEEVAKQVRLLDSFMAWLSEKVLVEDSYLLITATYGWLDAVWDERLEQFNWQKNNHNLPLLIVANKLSGKTLGAGESGGELSALPTSGDLTLIGEIIPLLLGQKKDSIENVL